MKLSDTIDMTNYREFFASANISRDGTITVAERDLIVSRSLIPTHIKSKSWNEQIKPLAE